MQKVVKFLEEKVEWLALGLGAVFLLYMVYANVLTPPGAVDVGGRTYTAGEIDRMIAEGPAQKVETAVGGRGRLPANWAPRSFVNDFREALAPTTRPTQLSFRGVQRGVVPPEEEVPQQPQFARPNLPPGVGGPNAGRIVMNPGGKVEKLPAVPAAEPFGVLAGMSAVLPLPGQVAVMPVGPNGQPQATDKPWATASFKLPSAQIAKEFAAMKVPQGLPTLVLQLEAIREEQLPDGTWGKAFVVQTPPVVNQPLFPAPGLPQRAAKEAEITYLTWARANEAQILQPAFYPISGGTPWTVPGFDVPRQMVAFNAQTYTGDLNLLTKEQRAEVMKARQDAARTRQQQRRQAAPAGGQRGPRGGPEGGDMSFAPRPAAAAAGRKAEVSFQVRGRFVPPVMPEGAMSPEDMGMEDPGMFGGQPQFQAGQLTEEQRRQLLAPTTEFDPTQFETIICWVHDDTVEAGKTYRYKLRYRLKNPIYQIANVATSQQLADKFDLVSDDKQAAWSKPVDVPARTQFFVRQGISPSGTSVTFELFNFSNGRLWSKVQPVQVGDVIGSPDGELDYTTHWTVADIRSTGVGIGGGYVLLVDDQGRMVRRDATTDSADPRYRELKDQILAQPPLPVAASPVGGFVPVR